MRAICLKKVCGTGLCGRGNQNSFKVNLWGYFKTQQHQLPLDGRGIEGTSNALTLVLFMSDFYNKQCTTVGLQVVWT